MNDAEEKPGDNDPATPLSGSADKLDDTGTTMRLKTLKLEGELWPEEEPANPDDDDGVDPYNAGRFTANKD